MTSSRVRYFLVGQAKEVEEKSYPDYKLGVESREGFLFRIIR